ncbi:hypothetical protein GGI43DRAFT_172227 [Trichoderma evansii]
MSSRGVEFESGLPEAPSPLAKDFEQPRENPSRPPSRAYSLEDRSDFYLHPKSFRDLIVESDVIGGFRTIGIRSKYLLDAIETVNKHPPLQPVTDCFTEQEPYPTLFYYMDDVEREIAQMNSEDATDDLRVLHKAIDYIYPVWNEARKEKLTDNMVSHSTIWKYFRPGDLVLRKDDIGNLWLFVLIQATYYRDPTRYQVEKKERVTFETWFLTWSAVDGCLIRKYAAFVCPEFSGQMHIKSLPVYPIGDQKEIHGENIEKVLAERGRKWWNLISTPSICQNHCGLAYAKSVPSLDGEKFRVCCTDLIIQ